MCQHRLIAAVDGQQQEFFYGFDKISEQYFLYSDPEDGGESLVGFDAENAGTNGHLLEAFDFLGIFEKIPATHITKIGLDLPCCE